MSDTEISQLLVRTARPGDFAELAAALEPEVSREQLANRWREHLDGRRETLAAGLDGHVVGTISNTRFRHQRPGSPR